MKINDMEIDKNSIEQNEPLHLAILGKPFITISWMETKVPDSGATFYIWSRGDKSIQFCRAMRITRESF